MKVLIIPNFDKENATFCTRKVCERLAEYGVCVLFEDSVRLVLDLPCASYAPKEEQLDQADMLLAIGGDGTIIHTAKYALNAGKPILGINAGRLGFLAGMEPHELNELERLITGNYRIEERMLLEVLLQDGETEKTFLALNDAVVAKGALSRMIDMEVCCNGRAMLTYRADGLIFSTPTGSTAYNLSAGGPIIDPALNAFTMTPIAPHSLFDRSILFAPHHVLQLRANSAKDTKIYLTVDGEEGIPLTENAMITIRQAVPRVKLIDLTGNPFYEVLNKKFSTRLYSGNE